MLVDEFGGWKIEAKPGYYEFVRGDQCYPCSNPMKLNEDELYRAGKIGIEDLRAIYRLKVRWALRKLGHTLTRECPVCMKLAEELGILDIIFPERAG